MSIRWWAPMPVIVGALAALIIYQPCSADNKKQKKDRTPQPFSFEISSQAVGRKVRGPELSASFNEKERQLTVSYQRDTANAMVVLRPKKLSDAQVQSLHAACKEVYSGDPPLFEMVTEISAYRGLEIKVRGPGIACENSSHGCYPKNFTKLISAICAVLETSGSANREVTGSLRRLWPEDSGDKGPRESPGPFPGSKFVRVDLKKLTIRDLKEWRKILISPPPSASPVMPYGVECLADSDDPEDRAFLRTMYRKAGRKVWDRDYETDREVYEVELCYIIREALAERGDFYFLLEYIRESLVPVFDSEEDDRKRAALRYLEDIDRLVRVGELQRMIREIRLRKDSGEHLKGLGEIGIWLRKNRGKLEWKDAHWVLKSEGSGTRNRAGDKSE